LPANDVIADEMLDTIEHGHPECKGRHNANGDYESENLIGHVLFLLWMSVLNSNEEVEFGWRAAN
jgi:hypothetical protein